STTRPRPLVPGAPGDHDGPMSTVRTTCHDGLVRITLHQPDRRNPLSLATLQELGASLAAAGADPATRVVVIDAVGPVFSAVHELREVAVRKGASEFLTALFQVCTDVMTLVQRLDQPVIA